MLGPVRGQFDRVRLSARANPSGGGDVAPVLADPDGLALKNARHVLILVHGYANGPHDAEDNYAKFQTELDKALDEYPYRTRFDVDVIAELQWPGDTPIRIKRWDTPFYNYPVALANARIAAERVDEYLRGLRGVGPLPSSLRVSLIGHSMGCRLILEMLHLSQAGMGPDTKVVGLMAAAAPVQLLIDAGSALSVPPHVGAKPLKFYSPSDFVLAHLFELGQWSASRTELELKYRNQGYFQGPNVELAYYAEPVGLEGNPPWFGYPVPRRTNGHSDYWNDRKAIRILIREIDPTYPLAPDVQEIARYIPVPAHTIPAHNLRSTH
jgi:pimeloyl-ACP methyl ester carboxylesterase